MGRYDGFTSEEWLELEKMDKLNKLLDGFTLEEFVCICSYYRYKTQGIDNISVLDMSKYFNEAKELLLIMRDDGVVCKLTKEKKIEIAKKSKTDQTLKIVNEFKDHLTNMQDDAD